jgi:hypothetical protein
MLTKAERVRAVVSACAVCFEAVGKDMWTRSERLEELWFEVDDHINAIERAEALGETAVVQDNLLAVMQLLGHIERELTH